MKAELVERIVIMTFLVVAMKIGDHFTSWTFSDIGVMMIISLMLFGWGDEE